MHEPQSSGDLVESAASPRQSSGRPLAVLAPAEGFMLETTTVNDMPQGTFNSTPTDETMHGRDWLADVKDEVAYQAAGQLAPGPPYKDELPPGGNSLPPKARKAAIDMLRVLVDMNKEAADDAPHMNQAGNAPASPEGKKSPYVDPNAHPGADEFGVVPLPANCYELADSGHRNLGAEDDDRARECGEESQETQAGRLN